MSSHPIGYVALLRRNQTFRRLWYGQVISQLGDWFDSIALYALLWRLTGSGQVVGALLVAQFLPATLVGLWAGVIIDRLPRKVVLITADMAVGFWCCCSYSCMMGSRSGLFMPSRASRLF